jgi:hypothetical protein
MSRIIVNIPEGTSGDFSIQKITTNHIGGRDEPQDTYTVLYKDGIENIMQDTAHEYDEHQPLWDNATGDVLIGGLGIGFVNQKLIDNPNVTSVTIVEKHQEVIDLVWNSCPKDGIITLVHDDIETWNPTQNFDCGWFDTWLSDHDTMTKEEYDIFITEKYTTHCNWIGIWQQIN